MALCHPHMCVLLSLSVYSPYSDGVELALHNIISPLLPDMDIFSVDI